MSKASDETPRMLPYVVQAVADLKDMQGSTMRKILDHVRTAINISNIKPKPRNVVMQVKRALKHAVDSGVLRHTAGKYRLILDRKSNNENNGLGIRANKAADRRRQLGQRKTQKPKKTSRCARHTRIDRYKRSFRSGERDYCSCDRNSVGKLDERKSKNKRRRRRSLAKKTVHSARGDRKTKKKGRGRRVRKGSPMPKQGRARKACKRQRQSSKPEPEPMDVKTNECEESPAIMNEIKNLENAIAKECMNQEGDQNPSTENETGTIPPECDNPKCVCNLKQEPSEDGTYENPNDADFYQ